MWLCKGHKLLEYLFSCFVDREVRVYFIDIWHFSTISPFYQVKMRNCGPYFHFRFYSINGRNVITWNLTQGKSHRFPINCWLFALVNITNRSMNHTNPIVVYESRPGVERVMGPTCIKSEKEHFSNTFEIAPGYSNKCFM